jgi:hypothetical protein
MPQLGRSGRKKAAGTLAEVGVPRLVPRHPEALMPLEAPEILWQR